VETGIQNQIAGPGKLATFREQVRIEAGLKQGMSEKTATRLREISEHDRTEKIANAKFVEWFGKQNITVEFLKQNSLHNTSDGLHY
jgi:hypothetical protein